MTSALRRLALCLAPATALIGFTSMPAQATSTPPNAYLVQNEFAAPAASSPFDIITGPDGNIWYTSLSNDAVEKASPIDGSVIHTYVLTSGAVTCLPFGITIGPDGNIWTTCNHRDVLVRIIPSTDAIKVYALPSTPPITQQGCYDCPAFLTSGPNNNLWFTENGIGYVSQLNVTTGRFHRYGLPAGAGADPEGITMGPDGNAWFTETAINRIGRMSPSGQLTTFAVPTAASAPFWIVPGPDGNLYYTEVNGNNIVRLTTSGVSTEIPVPTANAGLRIMNVGPDGNLWFVEGDANKIGSMTPSGIFQESDVLTASAAPVGITAGPFGDMWFTESNTDQIAKIGTRHTALVVDKSGLGWGGDLTTNTGGSNQTVTFTNGGPDSLAAFTPSLAGGGITASGDFVNATQTCSTAPIASGLGCTADVGFIASSTAPGVASGGLDFLTDSGAAYQQKLTTSLTANVLVPQCKSVAINTSVSSPQLVGTSVDLTGTQAGCPDPNPQYQFWLRSPAGVWSIVKPYSTSNTFTWDTTTYKPGTYLTGVWVKDSLSHKTYDAYAFGTFTLTLPYCTSAGVTPNVGSPQNSGTTINFTATPLGCPDPFTQWWVRNAAGVWSIASTYATLNNTFAWNTTGLVDGTYQVGVWVKQNLSTKQYDSFAFVTYTLTVVPVTSTTQCKAANVTPGPASPAPVGTTVTLDADVWGCLNPQVRWWVRDTSAHWSILKDYSSAVDTTWPTASLKPGTYQLGIWVRQAGSTAAYEAYSFVTYTLQVVTAPCASVGISSSAPSPQPGATAVTFTAAANGCAGTPEYKFFIAPPGRAFGVVQPYGASNTYNWDTTGLADGPYQVGVWVRNTGSTTSYEAFAFVTFQIQSTTALCWGLSMWPSVPLNTVTDIYSQSPQATGSQLVWNAAAVGCDATPEYAFYVQAPGSSYRLVRSYNSLANVSWNTAGLPLGIYHVKVLARNVGSTAPFEVFAISAYELI